VSDDQIIQAPLTVHRGNISIIVHLVSHDIVLGILLALLYLVISFLNF
jgi:hypothetical protein